MIEWDLHKQNHINRMIRIRKFQIKTYFEHTNQSSFHVYLDENWFAAVEAMILRVFPYIIYFLISSGCSIGNSVKSGTNTPFYESSTTMRFSLVSTMRSLIFSL